MKKEMILWFFFLVIFGVQASASSEHRHVTFTIGMPEEILPGINFPVRLIVTNNTLHPISLIFGKEGFSVSYTLTEEGSTKRIRCDSGIRYKRVPLLRKTHILLHPGESWKKNLFSFEDCSVTPGHRYCLDAMIQSRALPEPSWHVQFYWKGKKEIRRCIDYKVPTGVDRIVYKETNGCPMCKKEWILSHYPTSTYAGWILAYTRFGNNSIPGDWRMDYMEDFYRLDHKKKYATRFIIGHKDRTPIFRDLREEAEYYILRGEQFLTVHPNHPMKLRILGQMAWAYCTVHNWQKAYETAQEFLRLLNEAIRNHSFIPKDVREWQPFFEGLIRELRRRHLVK